MTIIAEPISEETAAEITKQNLANEDVILLAIRDQPGRSMAQMAEAAGWVSDGKPEKWRVQRAIASLATDKLVSRPRGRGPWMPTDKGEEALK